MKYLFLCLVLPTALVHSTIVDPRGSRPVEHGYKPDSCATEKEWPICTDDDWGRKCPSGCRIQGILEKTDSEVSTKITTIRKLLDEGRKMYRSADQVSKDTHNYLRERLVSGSDTDSRYASLAEQLRQRIVDMKIKIERQLKMLEALKAQVKGQVITMQRLEVDIDIKLRSCKGSCASYAGFSVDKESYVALDKQMERLDTLRVQSVETVSTLKVMKSKPLKDLTLPSIYKSGGERAEQKQLIFPDISQLRLSLEAEGSTTDSAATVSKVTTGTKSSSDSTKITTSTITCTKTVRKVVTQDKDGIHEKYEVVGGTGPGCETIKDMGITEREILAAAKEGKDLSRDDFTIRVVGGDSKSITTLTRGDADLGEFGGDFFKGLGTGSQDRKFSSSFTSSSSSKSVVSGGSKGFDSKTVMVTHSPDFGDDLGAFLQGDVEDDLPDIHARSLKSRSERKVDFVGEVCDSVRSPKQRNLYGHQRRLEQCPGNKYSLCTDEEVENKCPSGCRVQGLIDKTDEDISERFSNICEKIHHNQRGSSSMMLKSAQLYEAQRKIIVKTHMAERRYATVAERLRRNLTLLWEKSTELARKLQRTYTQTLHQVTEMQRNEVDIDIKLRACKGSCKQTFNLHTDSNVFKAMEDEMAKFHLSIAEKQRPIHELRLQSSIRPAISLTYRKMPFVRSKLLTKFEDIEQNLIVVDKLLQDMWSSDRDTKS